MSTRLIRAQERTTLVLAAMEEHVKPAAQAWDAAETGGPVMEAAVGRAQGRLRATFGAYKEAEERLGREVVEDGDARGERDAAEEALWGAVSELKGAVGLIYGPATLRSLRLDGLTQPRKPDALVVVAERVVAAIQGMETPPEASALATVDFGAYAARVETLRAALAASLEALHTEDRQTQKARAERDEARAEWLRAVAFAAGLGRLILLDVGQSALAERFFGRRAARRKARADGDGGFDVDVEVDADDDEG